MENQEPGQQDWSLEEPRPARETEERRILLPAILCSLALHGALMVLFYYLQSNSQSPDLAMTPPPSVRINLIAPPAPESPVVEDARLMPEPPAAVEASTEAPAGLESEPEPELQAESLEELIASEPQPATAANSISDSDVEAEPQRPFRPSIPVQLPSVDLVRSSVESVADNDRARMWLRDCNRRQENNELLDCNDSQVNDYSAARRNATYEALQPRREITRTTRSLPTVAQNMGELRQRLAAAAIPDVLAEHLLQQTDITISDLSNPGNRTVDHMIRMTDTSAAAQQAQRVLGDAVIRSGYQQIQQRQVLIKP